MNTLIMESHEESFPELETNNEQYSQQGSMDISGRRIVNIKHLFAVLKQLKHPGFGCSFFDIDIVSEKRYGLRSVFSTKCSVCGLKSSFSTESSLDADINKSAVSGTIAIGAGFSQLRELCSALDVPSLTFKTYAAKEVSIKSIVKENALEDMIEAGKEEAAIAIESGEIDADGIPMIPVIVDGAWSKRSYKSNYNASSGVACIIGARTKKVLYADVKNKYCYFCEKHKRDELIPEHNCHKNWYGTSTAMESQIILEGFNKSLEMHGVKFSKIIGDGDSSVYKKIKENKPYGPSFFIEKIECRNHLLRNYCGKLHELSRRSKVDMKIRHFLKNNILRFRSAVVGATKYWKQQNIENYLKIENLKTYFKRVKTYYGVS
jgi:hypothetical protein